MLGWIDLPQWLYVVCYSLSALFFLVPELLAAFFDNDPGDTVTELTRPWVQSGWTGVLLFSLFVLWLYVHYVIQGR